MLLDSYCDLCSASKRQDPPPPPPPRLPRPCHLLHLLAGISTSPFVVQSAQCRSLATSVHQHQLPFSSSPQCSALLPFSPLHLEYYCLRPCCLILAVLMVSEPSVNLSSSVSQYGCSLNTQKPVHILATAATGPAGLMLERVCFSPQAPQSHTFVTLVGCVHRHHLQHQGRWLLLEGSRSMLPHDAL